MSIQFKGNKTPGRNHPCPCGSKLKYKNCHGDEAKRMIANRVANIKMAELIKQEQKKKGIVPYDYACNGCGHGFDEPNMSNIADCEICPKCSNTNITKNVEDEDEKEI